MKKKITLLLMLVLSMALLVACGGKKDGESGTVAQGDGDKKVFRYGYVERWPDSKNPLTATMAVSRTVFGNRIYESLVDLNQDQEWEGLLAESWELQDDEVTWKMKLREGVKWHDGEDFNADDVVFTYKSIMEYELPAYFSNVKNLTDVVKISDYEVEIKTEVPQANMISVFQVLIVPEHIYNVNKNQDEFLKFEDDKMVGTNMLILEEEKVDEFVRYTVNDNYWGGRPKIDEFIIVYYANEDTKLQALESGDIDMAELKGAQAEQVAKVDSLEVNLYDVTSFTQLGFNMWNDEKSKGNPLIRDVKEIRQAIDYAIDYDKLIEYAINGLGVREYSIIPKIIKNFTWEPDKDMMRENSPEKAIELLESVGFTELGSDGVRTNKEGERLEFRGIVIEKDYKDIALSVQKDCEAVGIKINYTNIDSPRQSEIIYKNDFDTDIYFWGWTPEIADPNNMLSYMTTEEVPVDGGPGRSDCFWSNAEYDKLYLEQVQTMDPVKRRVITDKMQEILYTELPYIVMFSKQYKMVYNKDKWKDMVTSPKGNGSYMNRYNFLSMDKK